MGIGMNQNQGNVNPKLQEYKNLATKKFKQFEAARDNVIRFERSTNDRTSFKYKNLLAKMQDAEISYHNAEGLACSQSGCLDFIA